jgi:Mrp family chromosome partitioning ATPase
VAYDKGELLKVAFTDTNPLVAQTAVSCVITCYMDLYGKAESSDGSERLAYFDDVRRQQSAGLLDLTNRIQRMAGTDVQPEALEESYKQSVAETRMLKTEWAEAQRQLASKDTTGLPATPANGQQKPTTEPAQLTPADIAQMDQGMRQLISDKRRAEQQLALARTRYRAAHPSLIEAEQRVVMATQDVEDYAETFRRQAALRPGGEVVARTPAEVEVLALRAKEQNLHRLYEEADAATKELGRKVVPIQALKQEAEQLRQALLVSENGIRELKTQASFVGSGRISPMNEGKGELPLEPSEDKRSKLAAGGAFGGASLGVGLVLAFGFFNRRLESVHDARLGMHKMDRMLGVLPQVPNDLADAEQAAVAAHCVHHLRTLLQLEPGLPARRVFAITSPSPGDGKTTLSIALAMSFATSGARTLLIDWDVIGGGLSSRMDQMIRPKIGRVLCREGLITEEQLQQALSAAERAGRPLGEVLVELGFVTAADVAHATAVQGQSYVGLLDVLGGEPLRDCITGTGRQGLFILPLGSADAHHAGQLSPFALQGILSEARASFDVVLVDTGPILGSLEAAMAAAQADGVVLTVSRGVPQALVRRSLDRLGEVGAYVVGMVLNRAPAREVADFAFSSGSVRSGSSRRLPAPEGKAGYADIGMGSINSKATGSADKARR